MKLYIGITDNGWYRFLSQLPNVDEVNFWQPGGSRLFKALRPGDLFLFKLHSPQNFIVGGGFFTHTSILPVSLGWEAFVEKTIDLVRETKGTKDFLKLRTTEADKVRCGQKHFEAIDVPSRWR